MSISPIPDPAEPKPTILPASAARIGARSGMDKAIRKRTFRYTLFLGIGGGLAYSLALWAYEAFLLVQAHAAYPWIPALVGSLACVLLCTAAALLTWLVRRALLGIVFWVVAARLVSELAILLPLKIAPALMIFFEPALRSKLPAYPINSAFQTWIGINTVWLAIFFAILGLLQITLVETAVPATTAAGRLTPYFIFVPVMILASVMSSNMINEQLRAPLIQTNNVLQFAIDHQNGNVDPVIAREMHMGIVGTIPTLINRPRRLFLGTYDDYYHAVDVLVDFNGVWVDCSIIYNQPVNCDPTSTP